MSVELLSDCRLGLLDTRGKAIAAQSKLDRAISAAKSDLGKAYWASRARLHRAIRLMEGASSEIADAIAQAEDPNPSLAEPEVSKSQLSDLDEVINLVNRVSLEAANAIAQAEDANSALAGSEPPKARALDPEAKGGAAAVSSKGLTPTQASVSPKAQGKAAKADRASGSAGIRKLPCAAFDVIEVAVVSNGSECLRIPKRLRFCPSFLSPGGVVVNGTGA